MRFSSEAATEKRERKKKFSRLSPVSDFVFTLAPGLFIDHSHVLNTYAIIRAVLQSAVSLQINYFLTKVLAENNHINPLDSF